MPCLVAEKHEHHVLLSVLVDLSQPSLVMRIKRSERIEANLTCGGGGGIKSNTIKKGEALKPPRHLEDEYEDFKRIHERCLKEVRRRGPHKCSGFSSCSSILSSSEKELTMNLEKKKSHEAPWLISTKLRSFQLTNREIEGMFFHFRHYCLLSLL